MRWRGWGHGGSDGGTGNLEKAGGRGRRRLGEGRESRDVWRACGQANVPRQAVVVGDGGKPVDERDGQAGMEVETALGVGYGSGRRWDGVEAGADGVAGEASAGGSDGEFGANTGDRSLRQGRDTSHDDIGGGGATRARWRTSAESGSKMRLGTRKAKAQTAKGRCTGRRAADLDSQGRLRETGGWKDR